ncbi:1,4-alpha-glucan (glycogen) branching enzyme, GH-13-type [Salinisphaera sp. LB1]|nr:1,4-alpha-glucan branching protein GlgB [Salinisphaera sp. LB1]AWN17157.1 1,4-alpha-glucan (glycogen) branching enzyme, GH-13-type [Salinisphaera sp. LB1]
MTDAQDEPLIRLLDARLHDPHRLLGRHVDAEGELVRAFLPHAQQAWLMPLNEPMERHGDSALFVWRGADGRLPDDYRLRWVDEYGHRHEQHDAYAFASLLHAADLARFNAGEHTQAWRLLGAHLATDQGIEGTRFAVWAPRAARVSVIGDFNRWDGHAHPMRIHSRSGVWELFVPGLAEGALYKFEIRDTEDRVRAKTDPYGRRFERRPATAAIVTGPSRHVWGDQDWMAARRDWQTAPIAIYEVHLGCWQREPDGRFLDYRQLADRLLPYVRDLGMTHIEIMPLTEHPFDASWGYQPTGYFAPTSRYGEPDDLRYFVDRCHQAGIGVYLDWVPGHFPRDDFGLARFDGSPLYEHADPLRGEHPEWGTLQFDYGRPEVRSFLLSSALYWLQEFHFDGLRVDGVASMLYLDYARAPDRWRRNQHGGNEDIEAIEFLRSLNILTHGECPGSVTIAEESTSWPGVSRPPEAGGLGFSMKWNMGWMHDTLDYLHRAPVHRAYHHKELTFGLLYAFNENFVLPLSHDEVVHEKGALYGKMAGDPWQKRANLRLLYTYQFTYPGKKLLFMGAEMANPWEWNDQLALPHFLLDEPERRGIATLVGDLGRLYSAEPALHRRDFQPDGFAWLDCDDAVHSIIAYRRCDGDREVLVVLNFTPEARPGYRLGVPEAGRYRECFNSDAAIYGGGDVGNLGGVISEPVACMGQTHSVVLTLPPLGGLILQRDRRS